ncbi:unnamed protein product, partial [Staurois parvus]
MWGDQRVNCVSFYCVLFYCVLFTVCVCVLHFMQSNTKQRAGADRGEIYIVYIQTSPLSVILGNRQVPAGN